MPEKRFFVYDFFITGRCTHLWLRRSDLGSIDVYEHQFGARTAQLIKIKQLVNFSKQ